MTKPFLRVLQVIPALESGGVERGTLEIAKALVDAGHTSVVLSAGGRLVRQLEEEGSRHVTWNIGRKHPVSLLQIRPLRKWLAEAQFDIIHVRSRMPAWITWLAWKGLPTETRLKSHLVSTVHGLHSVNRYSAIMTCGERVIAVSDTCRQYILENYPNTPKEKIVRIYRGVDPGAFPHGYQPDADWSRQWRDQYPALENRFVITLPGRLTRLKGHNEFLDIVSLLKRQGIPVAGLVVGGEDPKRKGYAAEIRQRVRQLDLSKEIIFTGHRSDMREIYAISDAVVSLSTKPESFGRTVLEALAIGTPVVGFAQGGVGEILSALFPAGACRVGDYPQVAEVLAGIFRNPDITVRPNDQFLLSEMCAQTLTLYEQIVSAGGAS